MRQWIHVYSQQKFPDAVVHREKEEMGCSVLFPERPESPLTALCGDMLYRVYGRPKKGKMRRRRGRKGTHHCDCIVFVTSASALVVIPVELKSWNCSIKRALDQLCAGVKTAHGIVVGAAHAMGLSGNSPLGFASSADVCEEVELLPLMLREPRHGSTARTVTTKSIPWGNVHRKVVLGTCGDSIWDILDLVYA